MNELNQLTNEQVQQLYKAVTTGNYAQVGGPEGQVGGSALIPESLENTLRTLSFTEENLKLWKDIPKEKAFSTVEEYNVINNYGEDVSGFQAEGFAGIDTTGDYSREYSLVKCMNTTRSVTHLIQQLVKTTEDVESLETKNGMLWLLNQTERALFYGDASLAADKKEGLEWNGILKQVDNANVVDLKGTNLTDVHLNNAAETVLNNYGVPNKIYMPIPVSSIFSEHYYPDQRALMNVQAGTVTAGTTVTQFNSTGGTIDFRPDVFMRRGLEPLNPNGAAYGAWAPTPPTVAAALDATVTDGTFVEGTYKYAVVAFNAQGKSVPVESDPVAIDGTTKTQAVKLTITNSAAQMFAPEYFVIYRTEVNGDQFYEIGRIGATKSEKSAVTEFVDKNETLPNTGIAIIGDFRSRDTIAFKQLAPMFKLDYAMTAPIKRFGIFLYGTPIVYAPKKFVVIKNINVKR